MLNIFIETENNKEQPILDSQSFIKKWIYKLDNTKYLEDRKQSLQNFFEESEKYKTLYDDEQFIDYYIEFAELSQNQFEIFEIMIERKIGSHYLRFYQEYISLLLAQQQFREVSRIFRKSKNNLSFATLDLYKLQSQIIQYMKKYILDNSKGKILPQNFFSNLKRKKLQNEETSFSFEISPKYQDFSIKKLAIQCSIIKENPNQWLADEETTFQYGDSQQTQQESFLNTPQMNTKEINYITPEQINKPFLSEIFKNKSSYKSPCIDSDKGDSKCYQKSQIIDSDVQVNLKDYFSINKIQKELYQSGLIEKVDLYQIIEADSDVKYQE